MQEDLSFSGFINLDSKYFYALKIRTETLITGEYRGSKLNSVAEQRTFYKGPWFHMQRK